ncbi:pentatricopeptide repeat-containing protein [Tripterygium wilfordii]|uniref:Pentatricopeptide repeat-containing protein n=1 Tax=Tripterygium wilfordii TaxID=458696 RepID=A0A7J7DE79_TRIWF|nr:pentatricopeptide repeat-containing protein [Tripterygium wilfordii]
MNASSNVSSRLWHTFYVQRAAGRTHQLISRALTTCNNGDVTGLQEDCDSSENYRQVDLDLISQLQHYHHHGCLSNPYFLNKTISCCARWSFLDVGIQVHSTIVKLGFTSNLHICTALVDMYGKCSEVKTAHKLFNEMPERNVVTWNSLIYGYMHVECPEVAVQIFIKLLRAGLVPSSFSFSTCLAGCAEMGHLDFGTQVHGLCLKAGFSNNVVVGTVLIDMYSKGCNVEYAKRVFDCLDNRNVVTWTSVVTGYANNGEPDVAMLLAREMLQLGIRTNYVTYNCLLTSFSSPSCFIYCKQVHCRIILEGLESNMYIEVTLLTAYSKCSDSLEDFLKILELWPDDHATYVLISNLLAKWGSWDDAAEVRKLMWEASRWSPHTSPTFASHHDAEDDHGHHHKKSVLAKVKERAKKWRHSLSKKKHGDEDNTTPSWGVSLDDEEDDEEDDEGDPEYLGAPMYESELASDVYKETARQHPRADPVIPEKHVLSNSVNPGTDSNLKHSSPLKTIPETVANEKQSTPNKTTAETVTNDKPSSPTKTIAETLSEKLAPAYATISGATHAITNRIQGLSVSASPPAAKPTLAASAPATTEHVSSAGEEIWDKGVSMKEYIMHKFEPGEDERALSQVISEAMSPKKTPGSPGVVDMVREAVSSLLRNEESPQSTAVQSATNAATNVPIPATTNSFQNIPISTNAHHQVVEEENLERLLQTN